MILTAPCAGAVARAGAAAGAGTATAGRWRRGGTALQNHKKHAHSSIELHDDGGPLGRFWDSA